MMKYLLHILIISFIFLLAPTAQVASYAGRIEDSKEKVAGWIEDFKFHDLRHCFCTKLAQRGVDIYKIAKLAGHKDIRMTQRYSHHCPESLRDGVEALEVDFN